MTRITSGMVCNASKTETRETHREKDAQTQLRSAFTAAGTHSLSQTINFVLGMNS